MSARARIHWPTAANGEALAVSLRSAVRGFQAACIVTGGTANENDEKGRARPL
jgi:hypothetical protein